MFKNSKTTFQPHQPSCVDKSTQISPDDPDLFVFEKEVAFILDELVGKTLEQGLMEVGFLIFSKPLTLKQTLKPFL